MTDKKYSLPMSIIMNQENVWSFDGTKTFRVPHREVWYSNQYRQSIWDGKWYVYKTHWYKHKSHAFRWYRQRAIMSDYSVVINKE
jgi:hypothetical protein